MSTDPAPLARLYEFMRVMSQNERLELARWIAEKPALFNEWSRRSLKYYAKTFSNADEPFHPPRPEFPPPQSVTDCATGRDVAVLLADHPRRRWWEIEDAAELAFRFVDYELAPHRKTAAARLEGGPASGPGMRADLLLVGEDGIPIVGEIKAATEASYDTDPVLALVQGLTACAQLLPPQQMERLEKAYPFAQLHTVGVLDLFIIVVKPKLAARATYQPDLYEAAKALAPILARQPSVPARQIAFIEARCDGRLELRLPSSAATPIRMHERDVTPDRSCTDQVPTRDQITAGMEVARELRERYRVTGVLLSAAQAGHIAVLRCAMPYCFAAARDRFEPLGTPLGPWMPTHEHFPLAKRFKGKREVTNAVLAHRRCNNVGYKIEELRHYLEGLRLEDGSALRPEAIQAAIDDHVEQRRTAAGRYPRSRGSHKRATTIARQTHESLGRTE